MFDVVIVGGGLSGTIAALAARKQGAKVALAARSWGATALSTGALDIAYTPALSRAHQLPRTLAEHVLDIIAHRRRHPYAVLGLERTVSGLLDGFDLLREALGPYDLAPPPLNLEAANLSLASSLGGVLPAASALAPHVGLEFGVPVAGKIGVLSIDGLMAFDAQRIATAISADTKNFDVPTPEFELLRVALGFVAPPLQLARTLDDQVRADELHAQLRGRTQGLKALLTPPVLGFARAHHVRTRLQESLGIPVVESLAHLPSVPGARLQTALTASQAQAGVTQLGEVIGSKASAGKLCSLTLAGGQEIQAGAFVLASGRFIAGGVGWQAQHCREALFDLPVASEEGPLEADGPDAVTRVSPMESHPLMTAGVVVNPVLQPLAEGRVAYPNLFAAGMVIGGFASRYSLCADGVALATGLLAGRAAVNKAGETP